MQYIAALDYEHMDNGMFLTALAQSLAQQKDTRPIIIHSDSIYTDRIMQTGVMREEAQIRSIKDLNHRLVALFADQGISAIGINGYQRKFISCSEDSMHLDEAFFQRLPSESVLLLSTLVWDRQAEAARPVSLARMAQFLQSQTEAEATFAFLSSDTSEIIPPDLPSELEWNQLPAGFADQYLPTEFNAFNAPLYLSTARNFNHLPDTRETVFIR